MNDPIAQSNRLGYQLPAAAMLQQVPLVSQPTASTKKRFFTHSDEEDDQVRDKEQGHDRDVVKGAETIITENKVTRNTYYARNNATTALKAHSTIRELSQSIAQNTWQGENQETTKKIPISQPAIMPVEKSKRHQQEIATKQKVSKQAKHLSKEQIVGKGLTKMEKIAKQSEKNIVIDPISAETDTCCIF